MNDHIRELRQAQERLLWQKGYYQPTGYKVIIPWGWIALNCLLVSIILVMIGLE
jgi:hypothetical protein